jgi:hypothetical protein
MRAHPVILASFLYVYSSHIALNVAAAGPAASLDGHDRTKCTVLAEASAQRERPMHRTRVVTVVAPWRVWELSVLSWCTE